MSGCFGRGAPHPKLLISHDRGKHGTDARRRAVGCCQVPLDSGMRLGWLGRFGGLAVRLLIQTIYFEVPWTRLASLTCLLVGNGRELSRSRLQEPEEYRPPASGSRLWQAIVMSLFT